MYFYGGVAVFIFVMAVVAGDTCDWNEVQMGVRREAPVLRSVLADSLVQCFMHCGGLAPCHAINYQPHNQSCELLGTNSHSINYTTHPNYYTAAFNVCSRVSPSTDVLH